MKNEEVESEEQQEKSSCGRCDAVTGGMDNWVTSDSEAETMCRIKEITTDVCS